MTRTHHMSINIDGILRNYKKKKLTGILEDDKGRPLSDGEIRSYLAECKSKGWKLIPCSTQCEGFDYLGGGCPGHVVNK